jgi:hypothetical protein
MFILLILGGLAGILLLLALAPIAIIVALALSGVLLMVFWIWSLVNAIQNKGLTDGEKTGWVLAIVFFHFIGSTLYFFLGRPKRKLVAIPQQIRT